MNLKQTGNIINVQIKSNPWSVPQIGVKLELRRISPEHASFIHGCYRNDAFMDMYRLNAPRKLNEDDIRERIALEAKHSPEILGKIEWIIFRLPIKADAAAMPIGLCSLVNHKPISRQAEFLLGFPDKKNLSIGIALESTLLCLDFAFNRAGIHKLICLVYAFNKYAQKNTLHIGFKQEGFLREHIWNSQKKSFVDIYQNGMLVDEFRRNKFISKLSKRTLRRDITQIPPELRYKLLPLDKAEKIFGVGP